MNWRMWGRAAATLLWLALVAGPAAAAADAPQSKGVGPVKELKVGPVDPATAAQGTAIFEQKCSACHKLEERYVGPPLKGVTQRRTPEWIMNMILNPTGMTAEDATAQQLLGEFMVQMTFQNVSQDEARKILEYFRSVDAAGPAKP